VLEHRRDGHPFGVGAVAVEVLDGILATEARVVRRGRHDDDGGALAPCQLDEAVPHGGVVLAHGAAGEQQCSLYLAVLGPGGPGKKQRRPRGDEQRTQSGHGFASWWVWRNSRRS